MWQDKAYYIILVLLRRLIGVGLMTFAVITFLSLISHNIADPSFNSASTGGVIHNWTGSFGAHISDLFLQLIGVSSFFLILILFVIGLRMANKLGTNHLFLKIILVPFCILSFSLFFASLPQSSSWAFNSFGGVNGAFILSKFTYFPKYFTAICALIFAFILMSIIIEISIQDWIYLFRYSKVTASICFGYIKNLITNSFAKDLKFLPKKSIDEEDDDSKVEPEEEPESEEVYEEAEDEEEAEEESEEEEEYEEEEEEGEEEEEEDSESLREKLKKITKKAAKPIKKTVSSAYELPGVDLLVDRSAENKNKKISKKFIDEQSLSLQQVLADFGVKGEAMGAKVGPVVTLHEFEPAAGTKASRVIGLSDDIARSMSAVSARIAVVPGKTSLGIELPNEKRQMIFFREMIESKQFKDSQAYLPMILGKDIGGEPIVTDLAKMPHLLIAGTTGSGKSVGLNVMILSLLYRLRPDECRFIMIDPKMLELSIYDGIPHLLAPVVTEPSKAVVALKWVVNEMEERYRLMSSFGVRNIVGYNERAEKAALSGETLTRKVQTGYNPEDGKPIIEEIEFEPKKLPFIVVIVDEMADLMLVAGKEIEGSIQRLAQMARAAGIHIIMATQRPSVDVITGVIKANFPTRISFQVTSRIDSRTILGTQGAEQLLGQGDMIFMSGGTKMVRVHGPFCSDSEIGDIVKFIKDQDFSEFEEEGGIDFEAAVAKNSGTDSSDGNPSSGADDSDLYSKAVAIVRRDKKTSISYIQRQLRIGYNKAATLIEKMEEDGILSAPNVSGRRELLEK
jgi:S-DNA-T family DNA segregation ATPase FtsK/SpoIIIE